MGFDTHLTNTYDFKIDDEGKTFPVNKETGNRIPNPSKMGEFFTTEEIILKDADELNLTAKNDKAETGNNGSAGSKATGAAAAAAAQEINANSGSPNGHTRKLSSKSIEAAQK